MFITLMATGICVWLVGLFVMRNQPKSPNSTYGYRTPQSLKSQEAWDYAQEHGTRRMISSAQLMCFLGIASLWLDFSTDLGALIAVVLVIALLLLPMLITEKELKKKF